MNTKRNHQDMNYRFVTIGALAGLASIMAVLPAMAGDDSKKTAKMSLESASNVDPDAPLGPLPGVSAYRVCDLALPVGVPDEFMVTVDLPEGPSVLEFNSFSMRSTNFQIMVDHGNDEWSEYAPDAPRTYRGTEEGGESGLIAASLLDDGLHAIINRPDELDVIIQPASSLGLPGNPSQHVVFEAANATGLDGICGNDLYDVPGPPETEGPQDPAQEAQGGTAGGNQWLVEIAAETDTEYLALFGGSISAATNDLENLLNQMDIKYQTYVDIVFEITTIVIRQSDSYTSNSIDGRLNEFIANWNNAPETSIDRDIVQMFSGVNFSGGVIGLAPLGVVCNDSFSYSIVETRYTTNLLYRTSLSVHEMGHNWNSGHCDGDSDCRIMCSSNGGCGTPSSFGSYAISQITSWRNSVSCDLLLSDGLDIPWVDDFPSSSLSTSNWIHINGAFSGTGASNEVSGTRALNLDCTGSNDFANDEIRSNTFNLSGYSEAYVSYWTQQRGPEAGEELVVEYMNTSGDWVELERHTSDGTTQTDFYFHEHVLTSASQLHNGFRLRFRAEVDESNDDWYIDDVGVSPDPGSGNPPPENDDCENAIALSNGTTAYTTLGATTDGPVVPIGCSSSNGPAFNKDIWYTYTADCTGFVTISGCDADFNNRITVYPFEESCPTTSTTVSGCGDDNCGNASSVSFLALGGQTFRVRVGSPTDESGSGTLVTDCDPLGDPPVNDECTNPTIITDGATEFTTNIASESGPVAPLGCSTTNGPSVYKDVWFAYTADCTGIVTASTCGADFDSRILIYSGLDCPSQSTPTLACEDDLCGDDAEASTVMLEGTTILIRVGSPQPQEGSGTLLINCDPFETPCEGDLNGDDVVDGADLGLMLSQWGSDGSADLNNDGVVDGADLGLILAAWGGC